MAKKAMIGMSGGVDSSVAAHFIKEQGYETIGVMLKLFDDRDEVAYREKSCCSLEDAEDAREVCAKIGIPFYVLNFKDAFEQDVMKRFVRIYEEGGTPNPCIDCNKYIKFDKMLERAQQIGFDYVVTGHYARIEYDEGRGRWLLKKGVDETKDQSYVLYVLTQDQLSKTLLPLGGMTKKEIREIAKEEGFINAGKRDSQDICFVRDGDYAGFIEGYTGVKQQTGAFIDTEGNVLGEHQGMIRYTIGQRKGLGLALKAPLYVCEKRLDANQVVLGDHDSLFSQELIAEEMNLIAYETLDAPKRVKAKVRYKQAEQWATLTQLDDERFHLKFDEPQRAIAKGQAVVCYEGDTVVCGGTIA